MFGKDEKAEKDKDETYELKTDENRDQIRELEMKFDEKLNMKIEALRQEMRVSSVSESGL